MADNPDLTDITAQLIILSAEVKACKVATETSHMLTSAGLTKLEAAVALTNGRLRAMEEWKAKVEGMLVGSRATIAILALLVGIAGGTGIGVVIK